MKELKNSARSLEQKEIINDIKQGQDLANQLLNHLTSASTTSLQSCHFLVEKIIFTYKKALSKLITSSHLSSCSDLASINQDYKSKNRRGASTKRKRKVQPKWTEQVQVLSETGLEASLDDKYTWRKYGQKDIHGALHPRGYYKCTNQDIQGCLALKRIQRSDQDPTIFHITYIGKHTCAKSQHPMNLNTQLKNSDTDIINSISSPGQVKLQKRRKTDRWHEFSFRVDNDEGAPENQIFPTFSSFPTIPEEQMFPTLSSFPTTSGSMSDDQFMSLAEGVRSKHAAE